MACKNFIYMMRPTSPTGVLFFILFGIGAWLVYSSFNEIIRNIFNLSSSSLLIFGLGIIIFSIISRKFIVNALIPFMLFGVGSWFVYSSSKEWITNTFNLNPFVSIFIGIFIISSILFIERRFGTRIITGFSG